MFKRLLCLTAAVLMLGGCSVNQPNDAAPAATTSVTETTTTAVFPVDTVVTTTSPDTTDTTAVPVVTDPITSENEALDDTVDAFVRVTVGNDPDALYCLPEIMWDICPHILEDYQAFMTEQGDAVSAPAWDYVSINTPHEGIYELVIRCDGDDLSLTVTDEGNGVFVIDELIAFFETMSAAM